MFLPLNSNMGCAPPIIFLTLLSCAEGEKENIFESATHVINGSILCLSLPYRFTYAYVAVSVACIELEDSLALGPFRGPGIHQSSFLGTDG